MNHLTLINDDNQKIKIELGVFIIGLYLDKLIFKIGYHNFLKEMLNQYKELSMDDENDDYTNEYNDINEIKKEYKIIKKELKEIKEKQIKTQIQLIIDDLKQIMPSILFILIF